MDFFEAQDRARRRTKRLVFLFALAVLGTVLAGYLSVMSAFNFRETYNARHSRYRETVDASWRAWWDPQLFLWTAGGTLLVVGFASLYKWSQMRGGGSAVAEMVGGRAVNLKTNDLHERRLLNIVEEMSIASGIPMPAVYVLENEPGLNAFAAGLTTADAAVAVTRGTLDKLNRDELQGVIAHEFSHILNGDMRLNVRITAIVFGILVIGLMGRSILYSLGRGRVRMGGGKNKGGGVALIIGAGVAMMIIGYIGYFFGRMIQAAVSRQREFLADASAVQFTRNPTGISGALKKIGGYALGGGVTNSHAGEIGHFFFAQAFKSNFGGLWATHPALEARIRAVEPQWDGKLFAPEEKVDVTKESFTAAGLTGRQRYLPGEKIPNRPAATGIPPVIPVPFQTVAVMAGIGALTETHFHQAQSLLEEIPTALREATRDTVTAQILVYGLLLSGDRAARDQQQAIVAQHAGATAATQLADFRVPLSLLDPSARLPLLQLCLPALRQLDAAAIERFATTLDELVHADGKVTPFEFALQKMLLGQIQLAQSPNRAVQYDSFNGVREEITVVLSALATVSGKDSATAFAAGLAQLPPLATPLTLLPPEACGLTELDAALEKFAVSSLPIKKRLMVAAGHTIASDGTVTPEEGELYRALAATLNLPMPALNQSA